MSLFHNRYVLIEVDCVILVTYLPKLQKSKQIRLTIRGIFDTIILILKSKEHSCYELCTRSIRGGFRAVRWRR